MATECNVVCAAGSSNVIASIVTWIVVLIGWYVVHSKALERDRRREKREACREICEALEELQSAALDFHTSNQFSLRDSTDLGYSVEQVVLKLQAKPIDELKLPKSKIIAIRQRITGRNVDLSDFSPQAADSEIIMDIRAAISEVTRYLDQRKEIVWE